MNLDRSKHYLSSRKFAGVVVLCLFGVIGYTVSPDVASQDKTKPSVSASTQAPVAAKPSTTKPDWAELNTNTQVALKPLQSNWQGMRAAQKRKWLELSKNFSTLNATEQAKLHTRMTDWAALSPQQRTEARLNFAENRAMTDGLTPEQRKVQWDAYQLLSPEEKRKLADSSPKVPAGAATAVKPTQPIRQSPPPQYGTAKALAAASASQTPNRKITVAPQLQTGNSIVPQGIAPQAQASDVPATSKQ